MAQIECEQMLSRKEPGGLFAICSQGNFPLWGNFRASAGSTARDAAQGNPARLSNFRSKSVVLLAEEFLRKGLPQKRGFARRSFRGSGPLGEGAFCLQRFRAARAAGSFGRKVRRRAARRAQEPFFPLSAKKFGRRGRGVALNRLTICIEYCIIIKTMPNYTPFYGAIYG